MKGAIGDLTHFLRDDASHGVGRLSYHANSSPPVGHRDLVSRHQKHDHRFSDDAAEPEKNGGENSGNGSREDHFYDRLNPGSAQRE